MATQFEIDEHIIIPSLTVVHHGIIKDIRGNEYFVMFTDGDSGWFCSNYFLKIGK